MLARRGQQSWVPATTRGRLRCGLAAPRSPALPPPADIQWEIDLLTFLDRCGCSVSTPLAQLNGEHLWTVHAPEGPRHVVLFTYATGTNAYAEQGSADGARAYGAAVAALHQAMQEFTSPHERFALDLAHLADAPLLAVEPLLSHRRSDWRYLLDLGDRLKAHIAALNGAGLQWGVCHGDCHGGNAHLAGETLTFFDFDCAGPGWLAYDLGVFLWSTTWNKRDEALMPAYLDGYQSRRPLGAAERTAFPAFAALRQIWFMGLQAGNSGDWGIAWLDERNYDRALAFLKQCEARV